MLILSINIFVTFYGFSSTCSNKLESYRPILIRLLGLSVGCNYQPLASN